MIPLHQDPFDVAQKPLLYVQLALKRRLLVEVVELFQVFQLEQLCTFSIFYSLMIWPGRPNHDIEGWDLFSKNSGSREELKMVQHRILLRYFELNLSPPPFSYIFPPGPLLVCFHVATLLINRTAAFCAELAIRLRGLGVSFSISLRIRILFRGEAFLRPSLSAVRLTKRIDALD
ncbi:hypothetical protein LI410_mgp087 (mitochondrion) [Apium graveolens]|uniref:hypothetical protein n=1 Tax=Apium graveolens TaxID=4045 RepID=UPI001D02E9F6|nr:hypothetical protein LI410_mgp087 [Apium graveolens]QVJ97897.1 hypothetical protein [Apium graveolens]